MRRGGRIGKIKESWKVGRQGLQGKEKERLWVGQADQETKAVSAQP